MESELSKKQIEQQEVVGREGAFCKYNEATERCVYNTDANASADALKPGAEDEKATDAALRRSFCNAAVRLSRAAASSSGTTFSQHQPPVQAP